MGDTTERHERVKLQKEIRVCLRTVLRTNGTRRKAAWDRALEIAAMPEMKHWAVVGDFMGRLRPFEITRVGGRGGIYGRKHYKTRAPGAECRG